MARRPAKLTPEEERVIVRKGTELPFIGKYYLHSAPGTYACRRCGAPLYRSEDKFHSACGWPSFDAEIPCAVRRVPDPDGRRVEIQCAKCGAHLRHVFEGERITQKNVRHCVNSISLTFIPAKQELSTIVLGGGCFWCTEAVFSRMKGVKKVTPGYAGGKTKDPTYEDVCTGKTGHAEVVEVEHDARLAPIEKLLDIFFATHDPTSLNRQGNDIGSQYRSAILYTADAQKKSVAAFIKKIQPHYDKPIVTEVKKLDKFYPAEEYHRRYYEKNPFHPYCMLVIPGKLAKAKEKMGREQV